MHLYVHVPFCARRCSYCDFAIAVRREVPAADFTEAVLREWEGWQREPVWDGGPLATVYFGGGTPSRLPPAAVATLLDRFAAVRGLAAGAEVTLEANPDDVTPAAAAAWRAAGVNRVSLGVQSFDPAVLRWMHRTHEAPQAAAAVDTLRAAGLGEISLDLIYGVPASLGRDWGADLEQALALAPSHLSCYGLTVEDRTPLARWIARGVAEAPPEGGQAEEFLQLHDVLASAGYDHYEVSNLSRPGHRARHNSAYWGRAPFIGLGPSAHSGFARERRWNLREWEAYRRAVASGGSAEAGRETLDQDAVRLERLYLGLRTAEGVPASLVPEGLAEDWEGLGWARRDGGAVRLTPRGWLLLDALVARAAA
ncbi:MAG TPA: radical SAM family heme chaperone HemW [Gemmatimonadales bacterium]|nr:radical SAM family heme chaperone HemW [Gemmatimonadales bacterium]